MNKNIIIGDLEDFRKESLVNHKCIICGRKMTPLSIKESLEKQNVKEKLVKLRFISFNYKVEAFINYDRDFEYEDWFVKDGLGVKS